MKQTFSAVLPIRPWLIILICVYIIYFRNAKLWTLSNLFIVFFYGMCWAATDNRSDNIWINQIGGIPSQLEKHNKTEMKWRLVEWEHIIKRRDGWATCLIVNFRFVDSTRLSTSQFDKENRCWWFLRCWILDLRWHRLNHRPWTKYSRVAWVLSRVPPILCVLSHYYLENKKKRRKKNQHYSWMKYSGASHVQSAGGSDGLASLMQFNRNLTSAIWRHPTICSVPQPAGFFLLLSHSTHVLSTNLQYYTYIFIYRMYENVSFFLEDGVNTFI